MPSTSSRVLPKRSTAVPPALVDRLPPIVQLPSAASDSGNMRPASAAACCTARAARRLRRSASRWRHRRRARGSSARAKARSRCPGHPAWRRRIGRCCRPAATIGTPSSAQARTTAATSLGAAGPHDRQRAPVVAAAPVGRRRERRRRERSGPASPPTAASSRARRVARMSVMSDDNSRNRLPAAPDASLGRRCLSGSRQCQPRRPITRPARRAFPFRRRTRWSSCRRCGIRSACRFPASRSPGDRAGAGAGDRRDSVSESGGDVRDARSGGGRAQDRRAQGHRRMAADEPDMMQMSIKTMELQKASLEALRGSAAAGGG